MEKPSLQFCSAAKWKFEIFSREQLRRSFTFKVVGVDLDSADESAVTETKHGPLPTGNLQDPLLVHLQGDETKEETHSNCTFINVHEDSRDISGKWEHLCGTPVIRMFLVIQDILESGDVFWS